MDSPRLERSLDLRREPRTDLPSPPTAAIAAGYQDSALLDDFVADSHFPDKGGLRNWYPYNPYGSPALDDTQYKLVGGKLLIRTDVSGYSFGLTTISSLAPAISRPGAIARNSGSGVVFQFGYFECRMKYDNALSPRRATGKSWPAFWSNAIQGPQGRTKTYAELDFMEAYPVPSSPYVSTTCTLHEWTRGWTPDGKPNGINGNVQNRNNTVGTPLGYRHNDFNIYGCLWTPRFVQWFINNQPVTKVEIGSGTPYPSAVTDEMYLVLGTGRDWPVTIDFVHVWQ